MYWMGHIATLVSIFAIFATLAVAFAWRSSNHVNWQPIHLPSQLTLSTVLLLCASLSIEMARYVLKQRGGFPQAYLSWLIRTAMFSFAFVITQALCWRVILAQTAGNTSNESFFYVLTATHAVHILGGLAFLGYLIWRVQNPWEDEVELRRGTITAMLAAYWHFMGLIWLGLYGLMLSKSA